MIRALLDGRKTQTRRTVTRNNSTVLGTRWWGPKAPWSGLLFDHPQAVAGAALIDVPFLHPDDAACGDKWEDDDCLYRVRPTWEIGDRLWVREAFSTWPVIHYRVGSTIAVTMKWKSPTFMPRSFSRLTLRVTGVKVERLQDISEEDAKAEGCEAAGEFQIFWNSIYGQGAWEENPWVYVLTFKVYKGNIDAL
jgi:hypothetical protein